MVNIQAAPMLATLSKLALIDPNLPTGIIGKSIAEVQAIDLPIIPVGKSIA
jgi:hypothetical protein